MARSTRGRVTPKGTQQRTGTGRYTPPIPKETYISKRWVPWVMFTLLGLGMLIIVTNYLEVLPGGAKNSYLLVGLAAITAGFITATRYR
jgi:hypothetical protein